MSITRIEHVSDWIKHVERINSHFLRNQQFYFRGESKLEYKLLPSLYRKTKGLEGEKLYLSRSSETKIIREFMTEAAAFVNSISVDDTFTWIEYAQHFGVPTRLMDWTSNPLIALYFACASNQSVDGRVYILNSLGYRLLTNLDNRNGLEDKIIKEEAIKMICGDKKTFPFPSLFKPYYLDRRMLVQSSQFMVWGYKDLPLDSIIKELEENDKIREITKYMAIDGVEIQKVEDIEILSEVQIEGKNKATIQRELDRIGINQATVFPGLDGIGRSIEWRNNVRNMR